MKKILVLIVVLILVVLGYWLYKTNGSVFPTVVGENSGNTDSASLTDTSLKDEADAFANADLSEIYEDPTYGFSLKYPSGLEPILIPADPESDTGDMFIFEQNGTGLGFQIIVSEFLEENDYQRISEAIRDKIKLIFFKDIVRYFRIRNPSVLEDLFKILAKESGFSFNVANTARVLGIERPTLKEYLKYLTKAYLIESAEFYSESRRKRLRKQEKIYVLDPGIRNGIVDYLDDTLVSNPQELGKVVEGLVFDHLKRLKYNIEPGPLPQIFYWKNQKEIDFILQIKRKAIPVEVKYRAAIPSSAISTINEFLDMHKCPLGIIISKEELSMNQKVITIPLWLFLLMA